MPSNSCSGQTMSYQPISHFFGTPTSTFFFRQCIFFYGRSLFLEFIERERERERESTYRTGVERERDRRRKRVAKESKIVAVAKPKRV